MNDEATPGGASGKALLRTLLAVLASGWFVPVSCTAITLPWYRMHAHRVAADGESPSQFAPIAYEPAGTTGKVSYARLAELGRLLKLDPPPGFRLSRPAGESLECPDEAVPADTACPSWEIRYSYRVLADEGGAQTIEASADEDDYSYTLVYRASAGGIEPLESREFTRELTVFMAMGLMIALVLGAIAQRLRKRLFPGIAGRP